MVIPKISILLLPEDSGKDAIATLQALVRELLKLAVPGHRRQSIDFDELKDHQASQALPGQLWRSRNPKDYPKKIALLREIASKLAEGSRSFVLCHLDADEVWSRHQPEKVSVAVSEFSKFLTGLASISIRKSNALNMPSSLQQAVAERFIYIIPFYSIESWLYQNTDMALRICHEKYQGRSAEKFLFWQDHPELLDEEPQPKEKSCTSLCSKHNRELAEQGYPAKRAYDAHRSFYAAVHSLRTCESLRKAIDPEYPGGSDCAGI